MVFGASTGEIWLETMPPQVISSFFLGQAYNPWTNEVLSIGVEDWGYLPLENTIRDTRITMRRTGRCYLCDIAEHTVRVVSREFNLLICFHVHNLGLSVVFTA